MQYHSTHNYTNCTHNRSVWHQAGKKCSDYWGHYDKISPYNFCFPHYELKILIWADQSFHIPLQLYLKVIGTMDYQIFFYDFLHFVCVPLTILPLKIMVYLLGLISHFGDIYALLSRFFSSTNFLRVIRSWGGQRFKWTLQFYSLHMRSNI